MLEHSNVLILDEPTNHLDLASKEVLEAALSEYGGTAVFVTHDRYLLNKVPDRIVEIKRDGAVIYDGNYDYYCEVCERREAEKAAQAEEEKARAAKENAANAADRTYRSKEQRREDARKKNRIRELERLIEETEARIEVLDEEMSREDIFSDYVKLNERCAETDECRRRLEEYYDEWSGLE